MGLQQDVERAYIQAAVNAAIEYGGLDGDPTQPADDQYDAYRHDSLNNGEFTQCINLK